MERRRTKQGTRIMTVSIERLKREQTPMLHSVSPLKPTG